MQILRISVFSMLTFLPAYATASSHPHFFVEENELWREDVLEQGTLTEEDFNEVLAAGRRAYQPEAGRRLEILTLSGHWDKSSVNANSQRFPGSVVVNIFGGIARRPEMSRDAFALVLCHELSHAYGGKPLKPLQMQISVEGQADYAGAGVCLKKVFPLLSAKDTPQPEEKSDAIRRCDSVYHSATKEHEICVRTLVAGRHVARLLAAIKQAPEPHYDTPDPLEVPKTRVTYPDTIQCRVDTYLAGALDRPRPRCWFAPE